MGHGETYVPGSQEDISLEAYVESMREVGHSPVRLSLQVLVV